MNEEPDEHFKVGLFAAEGETSSDQVGESEAQGRVEALDMLSAAKTVQRAKNHTFIGR